jgi:hypothetical protein
VSHHHDITNQTIDLDGDCAHCESYFLAVLKRPDATCDMAGGRYLDRMEKRDGKWAVADRICMVEWNAETRPSDAVPASADPEIFVRGSWDRSDPSWQRPLAVNRPRRNPDR